MSPARRSPLRPSRQPRRHPGGLLVGLLALPGVSGIAACAPQPTALEKYCDVVHQSEAAFNPFSTPGAVTDATVLRKAISDQLATASALADVAPDAVRTDAGLVRQSLTKIANALAAKDYDSNRIEGDQAIAGLLAEPTFQDARHRLEDFNAARCA